MDDDGEGDGGHSDDSKARLVKEGSSINSGSVQSSRTASSSADVCACCFSVMIYSTVGGGPTSAPGAPAAPKGFCAQVSFERPRCSLTFALTASMPVALPFPSGF